MKSRFSTTIVTIAFILFCFPLLAGEKPIILYEEDPKLLTTSVQVVVQTGSAQDPKGKTGVSHLLAQLILRGTQKMNRSQFQSNMERLGGTLSAGASWDTIEFSGAVIREKTDPFLKLLAAALLKPAFNKKEFKALKKETEAKIRYTKNRNSSLGGLALRRTTFKNSPIENPVRGNLTTLRKIRLKDLHQAFQTTFNQSNIFFAVASPVKKSILVEKITQIWNKLPKGKPSPTTAAKPKIPNKPYLVVVHKPKTTSASIFLGQQGIVANDPNRYKFFVGNSIFGSEPLISRLFRVIRSDLGWTYGVGSTYLAMGGLSYHQGLFVLYATPSLEFTVKSIFKMMAMWENYLKRGVQKSELKRAQDSLINSYPFQFESAHDRLGKKVYSHLYKVPILDQGDYESTISGVNSKNIVKALSQLHSAQGWVITVVADVKEIRKQLKAEQKDVPAKKRLKISKVYSPDQIIR